MRLTEHELASPLWEKLNKHWEDRLAQLRLENEKNLSEIDTARLRGKIAEVKLAQSLGSLKPETDVE